MDFESAKREHDDDIDNRSDLGLCVASVDERQCQLESARYSLTTVWPTNHDWSTGPALTIDTGHNHRSK